MKLLFFFSPLKGVSYKTKASACLVCSKDLSRLRRRLLGKERDTELYLIGRGRASFLCSLTFLFPWHYLRDSTGTSGAPVQGYNLKNGETKSVEGRGWCYSVFWSLLFIYSPFVEMGPFEYVLFYIKMGWGIGCQRTWIICLPFTCQYRAVKNLASTEEKPSFAFLLGGNSG